MNNKRLDEISTRKAEIRSALTANEAVNLDELQAEVDALNKEEIEIREKMEIASKINNDEIETRKITVTKGENNKMSNIDTNEYREAFRNYVTTGKMNEEFRATATTSSNGAVVPQAVLERIVEKMETYGNLWNRVTKMAFPAGVAIPTASMGLTATWLAEGTGSTNQAAATTSVVFGAFKLQCRVAISMELAVKSISAFENAIVENVSKAMIQAIEKGIIEGTGVGQPSGIIKETVSADRVVAVAKADYKTLAEVESAVPVAYDNGAVYVMNKKTYMAFQTAVDDNGQPVAQVNMGMNGKPVHALFGREVVFTDYLPALATASADDVIGFVFDMSNYVVNSALDISIRKYIDEATDDEVTKATTMVDGKVVDNNGLVLIKKA